MTRKQSQNAPAWPAAPRGGTCLHVSSLPGDFGIGEIGAAARRFIDSLVEMQLRVWQFLPLGPTGYGDSPYQSLSSFAGNELLIDVAALIQRGLLRPAEADTLKSLPRGKVDFGALIPRKHALLRRAAERFDTTASTALKARYDAFRAVAEESWLEDFALYRVLKAEHGSRAWMDWPDPYRRRQPGALKTFAARHAREIAQVKIIQFLFHDQWRLLRRYAKQKGVVLFGDLPIYIPEDSADAWQAGHILQINADGRPDAVAGVPPDYFSDTGQLWGNPLYDWERQAADGFQWWIGRLGQAMRVADLVRIDHFRGFESYWAVPASAPTAATGQWLRGPGDSLFEALQDALGPLPVIAEDLGEITGAVHALRDRHGLPGMRVLQFEIADEDFELGNIPVNAVCYTGTHDNDTVRGWFASAGTGHPLSTTQKRILAACDGTAATVHHDLIRLAFQSSARLAIAPLQDFLGLGSKARFNTPGTAEGNWRWRTERGELSPALRDQVLQLVEDAGRAP